MADKDLLKLCILNVRETDTNDMIIAECEEFAHVANLNRPPNNMTLAFPLFQTESDAKKAKDGLTAKGYRVNFANAAPKTGKRDEFRLRQSLNHVGSENGYDSIDGTEKSDNRPYGNCLKCGDKAYQICGRCGDFYCSEECQESDWLKHKRNCFPMPKLVPAKSMQHFRVGNAGDSKTPEKRASSQNNIANTDAADGPLNVVSPIRSANVPQAIERSPEPEPAPASQGHIARMKQAASVYASTADSSFEVKVGVNNASPSPKINLLSGDNSQAGSSATGPTFSAIPNDSEVVITHARNFKSVYIRSLAATDEFQTMIGTVSEAALDAPKLQAYPVPREDHVLAPFEGIYYRAAVIRCNKDAGTVYVGYIDFGNRQEVPYASLKVLPTELIELPRYTFMVWLKGVEEEANPNELKAMEEYLNEVSEAVDSTKIFKVKGDNAKIKASDFVELFDIYTNKPLHEHLNGMVHKRYRIADLQQKVVNGPNTLMAPGFDRINENIITCILHDDTTAFMEDDEKIQSYGATVKTAPAYKPKERELCVVKNNEPEGDVWYRCIYQQELVDDRAQVYCIDYGKIIYVRANNIRAFASDVAHEIISFVCRIKNGDRIRSDVRKKTIMEYKPFKASSIDFDGNSHVIVIEI